MAWEHLCVKFRESVWQEPIWWNYEELDTREILSYFSIIWWKIWNSYFDMDALTLFKTRKEKKEERKKNIQNTITNRISERDKVVAWWSPMPCLL